MLQSMGLQSQTHLAELNLGGTVEWNRTAGLIRLPEF